MLAVSELFRLSADARAARDTLSLRTRGIFLLEVLLFLLPDLALWLPKKLY